MSTITVRLPEDLKARIAQAATTVGATSHNFILEAIVEKAALAEQRVDTNAVADQRYAQFLVSGESIPWEDARTYLKQRFAEKRVKRPLAKK